MVEEIFTVEATSSVKRRKKLAEAYAQLEMPSPFSTWSGLMIPREIQGKFLSLIAEGGQKVIETSLENDRRNREEKRLWAKTDRKGDYSRRIERQIEQKNLLNRLARLCTIL